MKLFRRKPKPQYIEWTPDEEAAALKDIESKKPKPRYEYKVIFNDGNQMTFAADFFRENRGFLQFYVTRLVPSSIWYLDGDVYRRSMRWSYAGDEVTMIIANFQHIHANQTEA